MSDAFVKHGEYNVPLIGISSRHVEELCDICKNTTHIQDIIITVEEKFICKDCLNKENAILEKVEDLEYKLECAISVIKWYVDGHSIDCQCIGCVEVRYYEETNGNKLDDNEKES